MKDSKLSRCLAPIVALLCGLGCGGNRVQPRVPATGGLTFVESSSPSTGTAPLRVVVADFNRDGTPDLAVTISEAAGSSQGAMTILLGNGDGTFRAAPTFVVTGQNTNNAAVADFNGDGRPDLAIVLPYLGEVQVLLGKGDGTFAAMPPISTPDGAVNVAVGDFNGDGKPDLITTPSAGAEDLTVLLGNGDGTFTAIAGPTLPNQIADVVAGDFNGDGVSDLAVQTEGFGGIQSSVTLLLGNGDGTFRSTQNVPLGNLSSYMTAGDFRGDGNLDLAGSSYVTGSCPSPGNVAILLGDGHGALAQAPVSPQAGLCPAAVAVGDFNGDGIADLVALSAGNTVTVLLGNGDGTFAAPQSFPFTGADPIGLAVGDLNGDGHSDVAIADANSNSVTILLAHWVPTTATTDGDTHLESSH